MILDKLLGLVVPLAGNWQRLAIYGLTAALFLGAAAGWGYMKGSERLYVYQAEQARAAVVIVTKRGEVTERVLVKYVKIKGDTQVVTNTVEKEVVRYVQSNPGSCLDARWGVLHDAAASNAVPDATRGSDAGTGAPTAAEALETVTANYAACQRTIDRLTALQEWVRGQVAVKP